MAANILKLRIHGKTDEISIPDLDFEHKLWKIELEGCIKILKSYAQRMEAIQIEYARYNPENKISKVKALLSSNQNLFNSTIKKINILEEEIAYYTKDYPINRKHQHYIDHVGLKSEMKHNRKMFDVFLKTSRRDLGKYLFV